jgi:transposase-like protein
MENKLTRLIELVQRLPVNCQDAAIEYLTKKIEESDENEPVPSCPHCRSGSVTKFGRVHDEQRYRCKECGKTFMRTTNTVMSQSHYGEAVWKQVICDTLAGAPLDQTVASVSISHETAFHMRHKILLSLETEEERTPTVLDGVCELDETYVLESRKGSALPEDFWRKARKHGATAQKRGLSNEYISICTGVERDGKAFSKAVTRSEASKEEILEVFEGHIGGEALILCDGAASYDVLGEKCECSVKNVYEETGVSKGGKGFYNINTVNNFHSFIKERYTHYRGVATKYLNRYNVLFAKVFRGGKDLVDEVYNTLCTNDVNHWHSVDDVKSLRLLDL